AGADAPKHLLDERLAVEPVRARLAVDAEVVELQLGLSERAGVAPAVVVPEAEVTRAEHPRAVLGLRSRGHGDVGRNDGLARRPARFGAIRERLTEIRE